MRDIQSKREREKMIVGETISPYCRGNHRRGCCSIIRSWRRGM